MNTADVIRGRIKNMQEELALCPGLFEIFERCFLNTIETTVQQEKGDTFVITGDIHAMWLRDSTAQVLHYLRFADDEAVSSMIAGLIARQAECVLRDAYANAFDREPSDYKPFDDQPRANDWVWERKYEIDSLCYPIWLAEKYIARTGNESVLTERFHQALARIIEVFETEQRHEASSYYFVRTNCPPSDTLPHEGRGEPVGYTGMTWSGFRPSDDACRYGYLVPSNLFAVRVLSGAKMLAEKMGDAALSARAEALRTAISEGIEKFALVEHEKYGKMYAYETDGLGNYNLMDDANVPSLLALPYLEVCPADDEIYRNTRAFVLSGDNPYYYAGAMAKGVGSPHTPAGYIWPIALCVQGMTSTDPDEVALIVKTLLNTHAGTGFMHESFDPDAPEKFTRSWFAWANSMFGELIFRLYENGMLKSVLEKMNV